MAQALFQHCSTGCNGIRVCTVLNNNYFGEEVRFFLKKMMTDAIMG